MVSITKLSLFALTLIFSACLHDIQAVKIKARRRARGERSEKYESNDMDDISGLQNRRILFADKWGDPNNPDRGGEGAKAKGLIEFYVMRTRPPVVAPLPQPTGTPPPVPETTSPPNPAPTNSPPTTPPPTMPPPSTPPPTMPQPTSSPPTLPPVDSESRNDRCARAVGPIEVTPQGFGNTRAITYDDTTVGALVPNVAPDRCNRITNSAPGVWYTVIGTGARMTASLCWPGTNFDSKITVYSGDCDGVMTCVNANDDASGNFGSCQLNRQASRVQWESEAGTLYYLLIHGFGVRVGDFTLNVINHTPLNDRCENAFELNPGDMVLGTTFQANLPFNGDSTNCGGQFGLIGDSSSVWYRTTGNGGRFRISTCNPQTSSNFDTKLHIFEGNCDIGSCIGGNDNFNLPQRCSQHEWDTQNGEIYYILVHRFLNSNGLFELSLESIEGVSS